MSLDPAQLAQAAKRGPFVRVLVAEVRGSAPREAGAEMLVWPDATTGTIGGGTLEAEAIRTARSLAAPRLMHVALGPGLGQCCGGSVRLAFEPLEAQAIERMRNPLHARPLDGGEEMPLAVRRALATARQAGAAPAPPRLVNGWLIETVIPPAQPIYIWGAGHVGRALVQVLSPLPEWHLHWVDTAADRFPPAIPSNVTPHIAVAPADLVSLATPDAQHLIVTFSHALDLELCHRLLGHDFASLGLIGSATKWARFQHRLRELGHSPAQIARIACPIGDPSLGKAPQAIAISVAAALLRGRNTKARRAEMTEGRAG